MKRKGQQENHEDTFQQRIQWMVKIEIHNYNVWILYSLGLKGKIFIPWTPTIFDCCPTHMNSSIFSKHIKFKGIEMPFQFNKLTGQILEQKVYRGCTNFIIKRLASKYKSNLPDLILIYVFSWVQVRNSTSCDPRGPNSGCQKLA